MKLHCLQAFRAVAAWLVVADHALLTITHGDPQNALTPIGWRLGETGVYVFFAISGFIMTHISWHDFGKVGAATAFLRRRVFRIVPLYWIATLAAFAFHRVSATHGADAGWAELVQSLLFIPYLDESAAWAPVLPQGWTLSYEMMFYGVFAAGLALPRAVALGAIGGSLGALTLARPLLPPGPLEHMASPIVLWFLLGIAVAVVWRWASLVEPRWLARWCGFLEPFGDASYATYLVHGLVVTSTMRIWMMMAGAPSLWTVPITLATATLAGFMVHIGVERPILRLKANHRRRSNEIAIPVRIH